MNVSAIQIIYATSPVVNSRMLRRSLASSWSRDVASFLPVLTAIESASLWLSQFSRKLPASRAADIAHQLPSTQLQMASSSHATHR